MRQLRNMASLVAVCLSFALVLSVFAQEDQTNRRIRARLVRENQEKVLQQLSYELEPGELILWVRTDGKVWLVIHGEVLGAVELPVRELALRRSFPAKFFGPVDEWLQMRVGKGINHFTAIYLLFEKDVDEEIIRDYQRTFHRQEYHRKQEPCYEDCCNEEHGYKCCPRQIDIWYIPRTVKIEDEEEIEQVKYTILKLHSLTLTKLGCVSPVVVSDGSLKKWGWKGDKRAVWDWLLTRSELPTGVPPLIHWLQEQFPETTIARVEVSYADNGELHPVLQKQTVSLPSECIVLLIVIIDPPVQAEAAREYILTETIIKALMNLQPSQRIILFATAHPERQAWDVFYTHAVSEDLGRDVLMWTSSEPQPFEVLAEVVELMVGGLQSSLRDISRQLQALGILPSWIGLRIPER